MQNLAQWVLGFAADPLVYPLAGLCVLVSIIAPFIPTTSLFVALGALSAAHAVPSAWALIGAMAAGSWLGDMGLWGLAGRLRFRSWRLLSGQRTRERIDRMEARASSHGLVLTLVSRFIPLGRTTIALVAGSGAVPARAFAGQAAAASVVWAVYSVGVGWVSGRLVPLPTWLTVGLAIVVSLLLGALLSRLGDAWLARFGRRRRRPAGEEAAGEATGETAAWPGPTAGAAAPGHARPVSPARAARSPRRGRR
ncbi:VTT domain-containing protein [Brevibacterium sp. BRM-1]|uniref:DedA family protein n=1 Tax=Brevibacterium sp. BRM-1 TaxID=2999062 RepID=UPI0022823C3E|nr:VTT domain-containing protein [Brevibacterium sp. BRM-1]WAL41532.1 VTT domain-containing protein [Brevibacterium sp. BRM-1]